MINKKPKFSYLLSIDLKPLTIFKVKIETARLKKLANAVATLAAFSWQISDRYNQVIGPAENSKNKINSNKKVNWRYYNAPASFGFPYSYFGSPAAFIQIPSPAKQTAMHK